jgi:F420-0:gamma-glutamyl ligase
MYFIPVKTRVLTPPQDDLFSVLEESLPLLQEGDVVLVSSKVVAIHQGRAVKMGTAHKIDLVQKSADFMIHRDYTSAPLTVTHNTFLGAAGIDESNGDGYYILLPDDMFGFSEMLHEYLCKKYELTKLGIVITDSHSAPFRYGATGVALAWWGINPMEDHRGRLDLFGREIQYERSNLVDGLAAGATVVSGEVDECIPVVIARDVPRLTFTEDNTKDQLLVPYKEDLFRVLFEKYLP